MESDRKKILVTATNESTVAAMHEYLDSVFSEYIQVDKMLTGDLSETIEKEYDLLIMPNRPTCRTEKRHVDNPKAVYSNRVYNYKKLDGLFEFEPNSKVYFVNDNAHVVEQSMQQLIDMGVIYFELIPYYPGKVIDETIVDAITAGESDSAPAHIIKLVDLGSRIPSIADVIEITQRLKLPNRIIDKETQSYANNFAQILSGTNQLLQKQYRTKQILNNVFDNIQQGLCVLNDEGRIKMVNMNVCRLLKMTQEKLLGIDFFDLLTKRGTDVGYDLLKKQQQMIRPYEGIDILFTCYEVDARDENRYLIYMDYANDISEKERLIRRRSGKTEQKHYTLDEFITYDLRMKRGLNKAKKIAQTDASVLIEGESGTGKEIIAQGIHYESKRKDEAFIAVNFAAIQPSLLDSELFGYIEGAFTGAVKGGSKGLIEQAHGGTLFLDEIGDAPMDFQVRLLRVLQEKEIRRVGSSGKIPVDFRVIAATNKDLSKMIEEGSFREDLYFRLNVMSIDIMPLRQRVVDIEHIFNCCMKSHFNDDDLKLSDLCKEEVIDFLLNYSYKGNVRELKNIVEYFACINEGRKIGFEDLPRYMLQNDYRAAYQLSEVEFEILKIIKENPKIGRSKIIDNMQNHLKISEGKIRTILKRMKEEDYIVINNTRGGCELTYQGKILLNVID